MCDIATAFSVGSTILGGLQAKQQGKYEQQVAEYNAAVDENTAIQTRNKGTEEENIHRQKTAALISKQRAAIASRGADVESGSALEVQEDSEILGNVDALRIRKNFQNEADAIDQGATLKRAEGRNARAKGKNAFVGSLISAGGTVASKWYTSRSAAGNVTRGASTSPSGYNPFKRGGQSDFNGGRFGRV